MAFFGLIGRRRHERTGFQLYGLTVAAARMPFYYDRLGVPDTLDGRFDMVCLLAFLAIRRVRRIETGGAELAQAIFDAMFSDMDINLREMGVGDLSVPKRVRAMWEAFHGRASVYEPAMDDPAALAAALARNVWRSDAGADSAIAASSARLARIAIAQDRHLAGQPDAALRKGVLTFLAPDSISPQDLP